MTSEEEPPTSYAELARILYRLPTLVHDARRARGLSKLRAAQQMGVDPETIRRLESGKVEVSKVDTLISALRWLDQT